MRDKQLLWMGEWSRSYAAALFELPSATATLLFTGDARGFRKVGWKAYDSWIRLANETANQIYGNPAYEIFRRNALDALDRLRLNSFVSSAFFGTQWTVAGLPIANSPQAQRDKAPVSRGEFGAPTASAPPGNAGVTLAPDGHYLGSPHEGVGLDSKKAA